MSEQKKKKLRPYLVRVRVIGEWWEEYEVEAETSSDAWDNWHDGDKLDYDPIGLDALEWEVEDVKHNFYEEDYDDEWLRI